MKPLGVGIIEGFYGAPWPDAERLAFLDFLAQNGGNFYLYAPKADRRLRGDWQLKHDAADITRLKALSTHCRQLGLQFGVGFTPLRLHEDFSAGREALRRRVQELQELGLDCLAILFDDMPGALPELAKTQAEILTDVQAWAPGITLAMCPTYYTSHDILDRVFGQRPDAYLETLGSLLPPDVHVFWTGPRVCSPDYPIEHLQQTTATLGRKPLIWDNYPVNDGERMCQRLHLKAPEPRGLDVLAQITGLAINPMNAPWLSRIPVYAMLKAARGEPCTTEDALQALLPEALADVLAADIPTFQAAGAQPSFTPEARAALVTRYGAFDHPAAQDVVGWLRGDYIVGPECITDAE